MVIRDVVISEQLSQEAPRSVEEDLFTCSKVCVCVLQMETNPVLKNITDYLIEEVSAEEEELAGASGSNGDDAGDGKDSSDVAVETDDKLLQVGGAPA